MAYTKILMCTCVVLAAVYLSSVAGQEKAFSDLFPSVVPCNYTEQGGSSCVSCTESLNCFRNNIGLRYKCGGFTPNCNNGHCAISRSENCTSSS